MVCVWNRTTSAQVQRVVIRSIIVHSCRPSEDADAHVVCAFTTYNVLASLLAIWLDRICALFSDFRLYKVCVMVIETVLMVASELSSAMCGIFIRY